MYAARGDFDRARDLLVRVSASANASGIPLWIARAEELSGRVYLARGEWSLAREALQRATKTLRDLGVDEADELVARVRELHRAAERAER